MMSDVIAARGGPWSVFLHLSPLIAVVALYAGIGLQTLRPHKVLHQLLVLIPLIITLAQITHPLLRNLAAALPLLLIAADMALSLFCWIEYRSRFSHGFALSVLETHGREATGMLGIYRVYLLAFAAFALTLFAAANATPTLPPGRRWLAGALLGGVVLIYVLQALSHRWRKNNISSPLQRVVSELPVSNLNPFLQALRDKRVIAAVARQVPRYDVSVEATGIDNYVVVIGESARPANMSLYGYGRPTTPQAEAERQRLLLFTQAVSGSPVTATAVPLALTAASAEHGDIRRYADNVINLTNQAGFETHWYSSQGMYGDYSNAITGIAMNAARREWVQGRYDDALLPLLEQALRRPGRKLIVLHLYGNHPPARQRCPEDMRGFSGSPDDDYDNAIRFTDHLLGQIFQRLKQSRSALLYFSDHGLERAPGNKDGWRHGGVSPSRAAYHVPMFFWHSPQVRNAATGTVTRPVSTVDNYALIGRWLGITFPGQPARTLRQLIDNLNLDIRVTDTAGKVSRWADVPPAQHDA